MYEREEITRLFKIRRTVLQMLKDRKYSIEDTDITMSRPDFISKFGTNFKREDLVFLAKKPENDSDQIYVFFPEEAKVGVKTLRASVDRMKAENVFRGIIVAQRPLTPSAKHGILEISKSKFHVEDFQEEELLINISNHKLVPKHFVLSIKEKKELLEKYTVKESQLPRMKVSDPIARYYGLKGGQVVKIIRVEDIAGEYVTYRLVV